MKPDSDEIGADLAVYELGFAVDNLADCIKSLTGERIIRANIDTVLDARHKLDDLLFKLNAMAAA